MIKPAFAPVFFIYFTRMNRMILSQTIAIKCLSFLNKSLSFCFIKDFNKSTELCSVNLN